jgi:hypothetical protein
MSGDIEEWRVIAGFPAYEVSNYGRVRRRLPAHSGRSVFTRRGKPQVRVGKLLKPAIVKGYYQVQLYTGHGRGRLRKVHALVCEAFHGPRPTPKHEAAHDDGNKLNNYYRNLYWATRRQNSLDQHRHGTMRVGDKVPMTKLTLLQVYEIRRLCRNRAETYEAIGRRFGVTGTAVYCIDTRRAWKWLSRHRVMIEEC